MNVVGALLIGGLSALFEGQGYFSTEVRGFLFIGLLGGLTTFSTFSIETINLLQGGQAWLAILNTFANLGLCLIAVVLARGLIASLLS